MWLSVNMPKTAGTSLAVLLRRVFRRSLCFCYEQLTDWKLRPIDDVLRRTRCIHGNFQLARFSQRFPGARVMTFLRDPVERALSHFHHWRRNPNPADPLYSELALLERVLGVCVLAGAGRRNFNEGRGRSGYEVDAETRAVIERNNADDIAFYRLMAERFEREAREVLSRRRWEWQWRWR